MFKLCQPPTIRKLLENELYVAKRNTIGQEHLVHELKLSLVKAEAALEVIRDREDQLETQVQNIRAAEELAKAQAKNAKNQPSERVLTQGTV